MFQSAGRIWGFWNSVPQPCSFRHSTGFNPPGGFGAFGTRHRGGGSQRSDRFQSAGRIWGFWNIRSIHTCQWHRSVSIRRADLGLLEPVLTTSTGAFIVHRFNPPGGFGAFGTRQPLAQRQQAICFNPPGGFGAFGTGLLGQGILMEGAVSIRRADLGLLEPGVARRRSGSFWQFQSAGRIWGFWNTTAAQVGAIATTGFNPPGGFGAFGTSANRQPRRLKSRRFNPPGGFGAFGTRNVAV